VHRPDLRPDRHGLGLLVVYDVRQRFRPRVVRRFRQCVCRQHHYQGQPQLRPRGAGWLVIDHLVIRVI